MGNIPYSVREIVDALKLHKQECEGDVEVEVTPEGSLYMCCTKKDCYWDAIIPT